MRNQRAERWAGVAALAVRQHSVVAHRQLRALALPRDWIHAQVVAGRLHPVYRGVYAVGHPGLTEDGRRMAAVLACGPDAVLSHWHAAAVWALTPARRAVIDISVPRRRRGAADIRVHEIKPFHRADRTIRNRIPITAVPRTLLDLAAEASPKQLGRAVNEAERRGWLHPNAVTALLARHPHRKGIKTFRAALGGLHPGTHRTRSDLENDFLALCARYGIPVPIVNAVVEGYEVDMYWPGKKVIVELDGYEFHRTRGAFETDRVRDAELQLSDYKIIRVTDWQLRNQPATVAARIRRALA